jgi:hypothetical protein
VIFANTEYGPCHPFQDDLNANLDDFEISMTIIAFILVQVQLYIVYSIHFSAILFHFSFFLLFILRQGVTMYRMHDPSASASEMLDYRYIPQ